MYQLIRRHHHLFWIQEFFSTPEYWDVGGRADIHSSAEAQPGPWKWDLWNSWLISVLSPRFYTWRVSTGVSTLSYLNSWRERLSKEAAVLSQIRGLRHAHPSAAKVWSMKRQRGRHLIHSWLPLIHAGSVGRLNIHLLSCESQSFGRVFTHVRKNKTASYCLFIFVFFKQSLRIRRCLLRHHEMLSQFERKQRNIWGKKEEKRTAGVKPSHSGVWQLTGLFMKPSNLQFQHFYNHFN